MVGAMDTMRGSCPSARQQNASASLSRSPSLGIGERRHRGPSRCSALRSAHRRLRGRCRVSPRQLAPGAGRSRGSRSVPDRSSGCCLVEARCPHRSAKRRSVEMDATATLRLTVKRQAIVFYDERIRARGASNEPRAHCWSVLRGRLNALPSAGPLDQTTQRRQAFGPAQVSGWRKAPD
jgi:hypothetical protein